MAGREPEARYAANGFYLTAEIRYLTAFLYHLALTQLDAPDLAARGLG